MATINGTECNIISPTAVVTTHNHIQADSLGGASNSITDQGYSGLKIRVKGYETTLARFDATIAEFMKSGEQTLVLRDGWKYRVFSNRYNLAEVNLEEDRYFPFEFEVSTETPYQYSTSETTRTKTITTNNQEWTADDSANDIATNGTVEAVPDIKVVGGKNANILTLLSPNPIGEPSFETVAGWTESENDSGTFLDGSQDSVPGGFGEGSYAWEYVYQTNTPIGNWTQVARDVDFTQISFLKIDIIFNEYMTSNHKEIRIYAGATLLKTVAGDGAQHDDVLVDCTDVVGTHSFIIQFYSTSLIYEGGTSNLIDNIRAYKYSATDTPIVYNTSNLAIKCAVANENLDTVIHRINADGTGTISFNDDFTTLKFKHCLKEQNLISYDSINNELDIADGGYIYYLVDTKYPITGIPTLTAQINITAGTPTIQISTDGSTWYDIDTAIVDDVDTEYELDNATSLSLKGKTSFYFRIDCGGTGTVTCSVKSFELDINIVTIDAENPVINIGAANTIRCDQDAASGMNCEVSLIYRDRKWAS